MTWAPDYITVPELKSELHMEAGDTADDAQLVRWVTSASRTVDDWSRRQFGQVEAPEQRAYDFTFDRHVGAWIGDIDDLQDTTGLLVESGGTAIAASSYELLPLNAVVRGRAYTQLAITSGVGGAAGLTPWWHSPTSCSRRVLVTALWGWSAVPVAVKQATTLQAMRLVARRDSPFGIAGSPEAGTEMRLLAKLDPDAEMQLRGLRRDWWAR